MFLFWFEPIVGQMKNNIKKMETKRIEELESKELLTLDEFKELGHYRMSQMINQQVAC